MAWLSVWRKLITNPTALPIIKTPLSNSPQRMFRSSMNACNKSENRRRRGGSSAASVDSSLTSRICTSFRDATATGNSGRAGVTTSATTTSVGFVTATGEPIGGGSEENTMSPSDAVCFCTGGGSTWPGSGGRSKACTFACCLACWKGLFKTQVNRSNSSGPIAPRSSKRLRTRCPSVGSC